MAYLTPEKWEEINPDTAAYFKDDLLLIETSRDILDCESKQQFDELFQKARFILSRMHNFKITREYVIDQINDTFRLIQNPEQYYDDAQPILDDLITDIVLNPLRKNKT